MIDNIYSETAKKLLCYYDLNDHIGNIKYFAIMNYLFPS